jgi:hypothetical protein
MVFFSEIITGMNPLTAQTGLKKTQGAFQSNLEATAGGQLESEEKKAKLRPGMLLSEDYERETERNAILRHEYERELSKIVAREEIQVMFCYDELQQIKTKYLDCLDKSVFLTRDQFLSLMPKVLGLSNYRILDKMFLNVIKARPKILGPKIPLNCISFEEVLEIYENMKTTNPFRIFACKIYPIHYSLMS